MEAFILVGGASSRMGTDKSQLLIERQTFTERIAETLLQVTDSVTLVGGLGGNLPRVADVYPQWGALGGLHTALASCKSEWAIVVACDLPFVTAELFSFLAAKRVGHDAVVPIQQDRRPQPLAALYRVDPCGQRATELIEAGRRRPLDLLEAINTCWVQFDELTNLAQSERFFVNINTPSDYDEAIRRTLTLMPPRRRIGKRLIKSFLPIALVILLAVVGALSFVVYCVTRPPGRPYVVTPESFSRISGRAIKVTDETWANADGGNARGWLLKGAEGAPAVVLLHRYGGDRSWPFNLGVKINETTNFTILWPDLRGHGENPLIKSTSLGMSEGDDLLAAIRYLRGLKTEGHKTLVGESLGVYGVELGAYSALKAARNEPQIKVLVLDSVVTSPNDLLSTAVSSCVGLQNGLITYLSRIALKAYMLGGYTDTNACEFASGIRDQKVMLLSGSDAGALREATAALPRCFPNAANVEVRTDLPLSGYGLPSVTGEQGEAYDRVVIEFFARNLR